MKLPNRREFLQKTAISASALAMSETKAFAQAPSIEIIDTRIISQNPGRYHGWPTLARRKSGELIVVCSGGRESHICPFGRVDMMRSLDGGETWTFPRVILDSAGDDRDAGVVETASGALLVTTFTSLAYRTYSAVWDKHGEEPHWQAAHNRFPDDAAREAQLGEWMLRSTDGGQNFSPRYPTVVNSPHGPIQLNDGTLLYAGKRLWTEEKQIGVSISKDDGQSWKWLSEIPTREGDTVVKGYHELHAVQCDSGKILVQIRNHNDPNKGETIQTESTDGGKTWTTPHSIGVWGLPSYLTRLNDGAILMTYGYRRKPFGNQARVSRDEGVTWSEPMTISDDGIGSDLGYPSTAQLDDGTLVTVWYEKMADSEFAVLRQARWKMS